MPEPPTRTDPLFAKMKAVEARAIERLKRRRTQESPPFPLEEAPGDGNGFFFADGDIMAAGLGLARAVRMAAAAPQDWRNIVLAGKATAQRYSREARLPRLAELWARLTDGK